jgi:putative acetyltransferase
VNDSIEIQQAKIEDIDQIRLLFLETINHVAIKDYNSSQVEIWSAGYSDISAWEKKLLEQYFIVAKINADVVGFASITPDGYLDYLYVHKNHQREGIASRLLSVIEKYVIEKGLVEIWSDVSITAKPFFLSKGFKISRIYLKELRGVYFPNTIMTKRYLSEP